MKIYLPRKLNRSYINDLMKNIVGEDLKPTHQELSFDFTNLSFIEPSGITTLGNTFEWLVKNGTKTSITLPSKIGLSRHCPIKYLDDSEFFLKYTGNKLEDSSSVRPTTIPLQKVTYQNSHQWLTGTFTPWLAHRLGVRNTVLGNIEMCLGEIFNNIIDHSTENLGCIFAQHFPGQNRLVIGIADFGIGIPENIRKINKEVDDAKALELAIQEGVSSKTSPRNMGAGLYTLIRNVVLSTESSVNIHSGYGILNTYFGNDSIDISSEIADGYYPGTFLEVNIDTNVLIEEDKEEYEEEFVW